MKVDPFDLVRIIAALQLTLVSAVLFFYKTKGIRHYLLGALLVSQAAYILCGISYSWFYSFNEVFRIPFYVMFSLSFLIGPLLFFYAESFIKPQTIKSSNLIHLIPFFLFLITNTSYLQIPGLDIFFFNNSIPELNVIITIVLLHIHVVSYIATALYKLNTYKVQPVNVISTIWNKSRNWVLFLLFGFLILWMIESLIYFTYTSIYIFLCEVKICLACLQCLLGNIIVFQGLKSPVFYSNELIQIKYQKNVIKDSARNEYLQKLLHCMDNELPYLDPLLTLDSLSEKTKIPAHHISQLLSTVLNKNFYDFINYYRVNKSKELLLLNKGSKKTILEIMFDSGFSSKSAFNNAFKKYTGITPSEFRDTNSNNS